jgi:hypothetical protein
MSQLDLARQLRAARPVAPAELRERVHLVAAQAPTPHRRLVTWRRALVLAVVVGASVAAGVIATRPAHHNVIREGIPVASAPAAARHAIPHKGAVDTIAGSGAAPIPTAKRIQNYSASLELRVPTGAAVSHSTQHAIAIATSLGGYYSSLDQDVGGKTGYANIRLRIPKQHVVEAVHRLAALGRVLRENVRVQDLTAGVSSTDRLIARLQTRLATLRTQFQSTLVQRQIASLTTQIERLQRGRANTVRTARYATVALSLSTPPTTPAGPRHHGPLHGLATTFRWIGIGAVYALAIGLPLLALAALTWLAVRSIRRRREDALLNS